MNCCIPPFQFSGLALNKKTSHALPSQQSQENIPTTQHIDLKQKIKHSKQSSNFLKNRHQGFGCSAVNSMSSKVLALPSIAAQGQVSTKDRTGEKVLLYCRQTTMENLGQKGSGIKATQGEESEAFKGRFQDKSRDGINNGK